MPAMAVPLVLVHECGKLRSRAPAMHRMGAHNRCCLCAGNIVGSVAAAMALQYGWGWSFMLPGIFIIVIGERVAGPLLYLALPLRRKSKRVSRSAVLRQDLRRCCSSSRPRKATAFGLNCLGGAC
jgi:hypothetical protein